MTYQRFLDALHPEDREAADRAILAALETHCDYGMDYRACWHDGSVHWLRALGRGFYGADGAPLRMEGVVMDIDAQVAVQTALKESNERLHQLAAHIEAAREEERTRISRELHDELGQMLTAIKIDIAFVSKELEQQRQVELQGLLGDLTAIQGLIDQTIQTVRQIALELRPGVFDKLGLIEGMRWQAEELQRRTGIRCELNLAAQVVPLSQEQEVALFRIFQEILTNVSQHSRADRVKVFLGLRGGQVNLVVRDNGQGISEEQQKAATSLGLLGMHERVRVLGGTLEITGQEGIGTTVEVLLPLEGNKEKAQ
jgi:signal transduction histidine kinase